MISTKSTVPTYPKFCYFLLCTLCLIFIFGNDIMVSQISYLNCKDKVISVGTLRPTLDFKQHCQCGIIIEPLLNTSQCIFFFRTTSLGTTMDLPTFIYRYLVSITYNLLIRTYVSGSPWFPCIKGLGNYKAGIIILVTETQ